MMERDLVIVGGGPAGLTAGLYAARARLNPLMLEKLSPGGQVLNTHWIENWPGDTKGVSGFDLADRMKDHAVSFGMELKSLEVTGLKLENGWKIINTPEGDIRAKAVILCPGASPRKLGVPGEVEMTGKGVSYCGTCDGPFYRDQVVAAVGGGNTAAEEAVFLTRFAKKVYLIHRRDELRADGILAERVLKNDKIEVLWSHVPVEVLGGQKGVNGFKVRDLKSGNEKDLEVDGVFAFVGNVPNTDFLKASVDLDEAGFIITWREQHTSVPGVFAAGDACSKLLRQIVVAAGEGAVAAYSAQLYLEEFA